MDGIYNPEDFEVVRSALEAVWIHRFHHAMPVEASLEIVRDVLVSCGVPQERIELAIEAQIAISNKL